MKAVRIHSHGGSQKLQFEDIPEPDCKPDKIKIKIHASAINHLDIWIRKGLIGINLNLPHILGSDGSGTIAEIGSSISDWRVGDKVVIQPGIFCNKCAQCKKSRENCCSQYGILGETVDGVQAEYVIVDPINIYSKPDHLSFVEAASMPLVFMTAYQMLVKRAKIQNNETVLVFGGASGVGSAAIQICRDMNANVIATVGSTDKIKHVKKMGAQNVVLHNGNVWPDEIKKIIGKRGVDVVFEHIGKQTWNESLRILAKGGRIVTCGATTGKDVRINLAHLFIKQHSILGSTMSSLSTYNEVMNKIHNNIYFPFVDKIFKMHDIRLAHQYIENRKHKGKVVMEFD